MGPMGAIGPMGPTGPAGLVGPTGPAGPTGPLPNVQLLGGLVGTGTIASPLGVDFAGSGSLSTVARSDHSHTEVSGKSLEWIECEARLGVWASNACSELAVVGCTGRGWNAALTSCPAGRHMCSTPELYMGGFLSFASQLRRGLVAVPSPAAYIWSRGYDPAGSPNTTGNQLFYPWGLDTSRLNCNASAAPMIGFRSNNGGAMGCYDKSYTGTVALCCSDGAF